jgi:hypothetical protein
MFFFLLTVGILYRVHCEKSLLPEWLLHNYGLFLEKVMVPLLQRLSQLLHLTRHE